MDNYGGDMRRYFAILAVMFCTAAAAEQMPTDVDLKTAYCLKVKQRQVAFINSFAEPTTSAGQDYKQKMLRDHSTEVNRLQSYLLPKLKYLDLNALQGAANRAEADVNDSEGMSKQCIARCDPHVVNGTLTEKWRVCLEGCTADFPAATRVSACQKIDWLPF